MGVTKSYTDLAAEIEELKIQLEEAQDTINAIRLGEVDALIVVNNNDHELYTLKTADQTYRLLVEKILQGGVTLSKEGITLYSNTSFAEMLGLPLKEVIGYNFEDFIPQRYKNEVRRLIKSAITEEQETEIIIEHSDGREIPVLLSINSFDIDDVTSISIIITDLSFQKETKQQLLQKNEELEQLQLETRKLNESLEETVRVRTSELFKSREHFRFLANNIPAIVWMANSAGHHDYFNKRWFEFTGFQETESEFDILDAVHEDDRDQYRDLWNKSLLNEVPFEVIHRLKNQRDEYKWYFSKALPFKDETEQTVSWLGMITDIDEHKKAMEKKDEFISIVSHELKTPVTSIKGYIQLLRYNFRQEGNSGAADVLSKVDLQVNKLTTLINDLLDVKKIENGQLQYRKEVFDFNGLVKEVIEEISRVLVRHRLSFEASDSKTITGDRNKIGQVIINLIDNAAKYSPADTDILVKTENENNKVKLFVKDFGKGIPSDQRDKIFQRFSRVTDEHENTYSGLGIGLFISREIINRHQGSIGFNSEKGKGSTFYFELPANV